MDIYSYVTVWMLISSVYGYPNGSPETVCIDHFPHHKHLPSQSSPSPYVIDVTPTTYNPGDILTLRIHSPTGQEFKGYQVRAMQVDGNIEKFIGTFVNVSSQSNLQSWYPEDVTTANCFTHSNNDDKTEVIATWKAPNISVGDVVFRGTIMKNFEVFWAHVTSEPISSNAVKERHYDPHNVATRVPNHDFVEDCGETKSCVLYPDGCYPDKCSHVIAYSANHMTEMIEFEIFVRKAEAYVSIGFSHDLMMGEDSTVNCVAVDDYREVHHGYSPARYNERHVRNPATLAETAVERKDKSVYCSFKRSFKDRILKYTFDTHDPYYVDIDLTTPQVLQLAWGGVYIGTPIPWKHDELPLNSPKKAGFAVGRL